MRTKLTSVAVVAMLLIAGMSGGVVAQTEEEASLFEQLTGLETDDETTIGERIDAANAAIASIGKRATHSASTAQATILGGKTNQDLTDQYAQDTKQAFNANNETLESYVNSRVAVPVENWDVIAVEHTEGDATSTVYLTATNNSSTFDDAVMVNSTNRTVDKTLTLEGAAAAEADDELAYFAENYAAKDKNVDRSLVTRMQAYVDQITLPDGVQA